METFSTLEGLSIFDGKLSRLSKVWAYSIQNYLQYFSTLDRLSIFNGIISRLLSVSSIQWKTFSTFDRLNILMEFFFDTRSHIQWNNLIWLYSIKNFFDFLERLNRFNRNFFKCIQWITFSTLERLIVFDRKLFRIKKNDWEKFWI